MPVDKKRGGRGGEEDEVKTNFDGNLMAARPTLKEIARMSGRRASP